MAPKHVYTVSSSPPRPFTTYSMSSPLPSPNKLFKRKASVLGAGSCAAHIPQNATASFTSASSLLRLDIEGSVDTIRSSRRGPEGENEVDVQTKPAKPKSRRLAVKDRGEGEVAKKPRKTAATKDDNTCGTEVKKPRKSRAKKVDDETIGGEVKEKVPRKSRAKKVDEDAVATKEKAPRKPRAKRTDGNTQAKLPQGQVTKSLTSKNDVKNAIAKSKAAVEDDLLTNSLDYGLDAAVRRRINWTPPAVTAQSTFLTTPAPRDLLDAMVSGGSLASEEKSKGFQDLLGNFGLSKLECNATANTIMDGAVIKKRKLIQMVEANTTAIAPTKPKAPKKKARTITEAATSAYAEVIEEPAQTSSLLKYFPSEPFDSATNGDFKLPKKPQSRSPVKGGKGIVQAPILLSPESAIKQVGNQDFVFGTSSQLAREESPTFLRDMHAAMQASNEVEVNDDPFASSPTHFGTRNQNIPLKNRNLWSAAARDDGGKMLNVEMIDLADTPAVTRHYSTAVAKREELLSAEQEDVEPQSNIEEIAGGFIPKAAMENSCKSIGPVEAAIRLALLSSPASSKTSLDETSISKVASPRKAPVTKSPKTKKTKDVVMPDFEAYTMFQLSKQITSYGFKSIKSRDQMISLLKKCWESKQRIAMSALSTNLPPSSNKTSKLANEPPSSSQAQTASPKRPRGRPRKDSSGPSTPKRGTKTASIANALARAQKRSEALDEISDSDTAITPSPPRRHPSQVGTPPLPLQLSPSASLDDRELSPNSAQILLFQHITTAVKLAPPATDSSTPSWHEKILLYDPIILEDLTIWLNTGALEKAGWDGEVDPKEVKKWCESKSICCLWKENLRGGSRSRY